MQASAAAVWMRGIHKRFGAVQANRGVDLQVQQGTVHGIVGENGAGKSTLMSILYGACQADEGHIEIDGQTVTISDSRQALRLGIGMVHQHFMLVDHMSALDNVLLGDGGPWKLPAARQALRQRLQSLMEETGLHVPLDDEVRALTVGQRQRLEILKALSRGVRILILDEPTAVLTPGEADRLFEVLQALRDRGTTIVLISHKLREIMAWCDRVTVMRAGQVVLDTDAASTSVAALAQAMVGRSVEQGPRTLRPLRTFSSVRTVLKAEDLYWRDELGVPRLADVGLELRGGEIVGVAGVSGNGQSELLAVLAGMLTPERGRLQVAGRHFEAPRWLDPRTAREIGVAHVPEDRLNHALVLPFAAWESAVLGHETWDRYGRAVWMKPRAMREDTAQMMQAYDVRPPEPRRRSASFSGGNQQKLVMARESLNGPPVMLIGQPTRGVDIGAIEFIHARLREQRDAGAALLIVSSELDEVLALADRVIVMNGGRISGELSIRECDEARLGRLIGGAAA